MIIKKFEVEGSGEFPIDMLRYDQCWPTDTADALKIRPAYGGDGSGLERRTISLSTTRKICPDARPLGQLHLARNRLMPRDGGG
jgi:hypothetical protein